MLSVSKLGTGQEGYYLDTVAQGVEDYYLGHGEAPGRWMGSASALLGLEGEVDAQDLRAVLEGRNPIDGTRLVQARKDRVPGFDLTFSAPKSVSVLFGLGDPDTVRAVRAAHDRSVDAALGWLEREACMSRRGIDGVEHIGADGFAAAAFVHRSSRAGDPQLHTHVLVANLTRCDDGLWRTLHGGPIFWQARTAGYLYKAQLRHELTARLGVEWGPIHKGAAEIIDIPPELCALFSTRRREIQDELDARGEHSPRAARVAALETHQAKDYGVDIGALRDRWHDQALEAGHAPAIVTAALVRAETQPINRAAERAGTETLLGPHGLTEQATTFDRRTVLRAWCEQLPAGAPITTIEELAASTLRDPRVIALQTRDPYARYSTSELIALERRLVRVGVAALDSNKGVVNEDLLRAILDARPELSPQQVAAIAAITTSGNGIDLVVAAAGTGKTFCLDAAHDAWRRAGYRVVGAALAATAAAELQAQTGIPSDTIALRTLQLADSTLQLDPQTVVVIDEAAMASTRGLAPLLDAAHDRGAKVVMVGDPHQLDAIDAGGLLNGLAHRLPPVTLTENRRQQHIWERQALSSLRAGGVVAALDAYQEHDRVVVAHTAIDVRNRMAADWYAATLAGDTVVMLAERHSDVDDLNERARRHLIRGGVLTGPELCVAADTFQAGDRILCMRNNRRMGVRNGTLATVIDVDPEERALVVRARDGNTIHLSSQYLDDGHVRHGYARTIHKAQGLSVDRCFVLASDTLDHHGGYTALSRGRIDNRIYLVEQPPIDPEAHHQARETPHPRRQLAAALLTDHADRLAIDHRVDVVALGADLVRLYHERAQVYPVQLAAPPDRTADIAALDRERRELIRALDSARSTLDDVVAHRPKLRRRQEHTAALLAAERARDHTVQAVDRVQHALDEVRSGQIAHRQYHNAHGGELTKLANTERRIDGRLEELVDALAVDQPRYLASLGPPPNTGWERHQWRRGVRDVESYRAQNNVTDPRRPFGACPTENVARAAWHHAAATFALDAHQLGAARDSLGRGQQHDQGLELEIGL